MASFFRSNSSNPVSEGDDNVLKITLDDVWKDISSDGGNVFDPVVDAPADLVDDKQPDSFHEISSACNASHLDDAATNRALQAAKDQASQNLQTLHSQTFKTCSDFINLTERLRHSQTVLSSLSEPLGVAREGLTGIVRTLESLAFLDSTFAAGKEQDSPKAT